MDNNVWIHNLTEYRRNREISYLDIERDVGISPARMRELESGNRAITVDELEKLLAYYKLTCEQVFRVRKRKKPDKSAAVRRAGGLVLAAGIFGVLAGFLLNGLPLTDAGGGSVATEAAGTAGVSAGGVSADGSSVGAISENSAENASTETPAGRPAEPAAPAEAAKPAEAAEPAGPETVTFRFWGNLPYHAESIPRAPEQSGAKIIDIFPIQQLDDAPLPDWLKQRDKEQLILNAGTTEIWTPTALQAFQSLKDEGFQAIGLGLAPDVYEPLVLQVNDKKVGFLSLAGLIRNAGEVAIHKQPGLPRAYRKDEVVQAVQAAKAQADYLFVLIDWGQRWDRKPNARQRQVAEWIVEAGGDLIVGNRPIHAQPMAALDGKPVFYALGHSVSEEAGENAYNFILEAEFSTQLDKVTAVFGKMAEGALRFELNEEDRDRIRAAFGDKERLPDGVEAVW